MGMMEKIRKFSSENQRRRNVIGDGRKLQDIFHKFKDNENIIRLVGEFVVVKTHFISPDVKTGQRGLCVRDAFSPVAENRLPAVVNCANWNIETEQEADEQICVICRLNAIAKNQLKDESISSEERLYYTNLVASTNPRTAMKWNIIDRANPYITEIIDGEPKKMFGYKIATIGMEAWFDIEGIFKQCGFDITDVDEGIDICVTRGRQGQRVSYSAQAVIVGTTVKVTPLTDDEKEMSLHDIRRICGRIVNQDHIVKYLHNDYKTTLEAFSDDEKVPPVTSNKTKKSSKTNLNQEEAEESLYSNSEDDESFDDGEMKFECFGSYVEGDKECLDCQAAEACKDERKKRNKS